MKNEVNIMHFTEAASKKKNGFSKRASIFGIMMMTRYFFITIMLVVVTTLFLGFLLLVRPEYFNTHTTLLSSMQHLDDEVHNITTQKRYVENLINSYQALGSAQKRKVSHVIPDQLSTADLFLLFEDFAHKENMRIRNITLTDDQESVTEKTATKESTKQSDGSAKGATASTAVQHQVTIVLETASPTSAGISYTQFKGFLASLENHTPLFDLPIITFTPGQKVFTLTLTTYTMP